jgi:hypothetical protein
MAFVVVIEAIVLVVIESDWAIHRYIDEGKDRRNGANEECVFK